MGKHLLAVFILLWATLFFIAKAQGEVLQILHTNDLHGFLENTVEIKTRGGYAAIKAKIEFFKKEAAKLNIKTVALDAGDFMEGNLFYMAEKGKSVLNIMSEMGYDAVALGNHDWLMGTKDLNALFKSTPPRFDLLAANVAVNAILYPEIKKNIRPYKIIDINGKKLAILGLTTDEVFYKWRFYEGRINSPVKTAVKLAKQLRNKEGADFVVALTHTGLEVDKVIASKSQVDLVVGGHSHTLLKEPVWALNSSANRYVPIVQTGAHGNYLGRLLVEVVKGKPLKVLKYETIVISQELEDKHIGHHVHDARKKLNQFYGQSWLNQTVGKSTIPLSNSETKITPWTSFVVDSIKESRNSHIAFHSSALAGSDLPPGNIAREELFNTYPRFFDLNDHYGWHVYDVKIMGLFLKVLIHAALKSNYTVAISGATFDLVAKDGSTLTVDNDDLIDNDLSKKRITDHLGFSKFKIKNIKINGNRVSLTRMYHVALPEGFVKGSLGISSFFKFVLKRVYKTETTVISAMEKKFKKIGVLTEDYAEKRDPKRTKGTMYVLHGKNQIRLLKRVSPADTQQKVINSKVQYQL